MRKRGNKAAFMILALLMAAQLGGCAGNSTQETGSAAAEATVAETTVESVKDTTDGSGRDDGADSKTAGEGETVAPEAVVEDWMIPIPGSEVKDGEYNAEVKSSSSMFKITDCKLTVKNGTMTAVITMSGTGYSELYMGTGQEAVLADESAYIQAVEQDGVCTFEIPVKALDEAIDCAAFSKRKEKWYDRKLAFLSSSLGTDALKEVKMTPLSELALEDGTYEAEVVLEGGSGRASVESPAVLTVKGGTVMAKVIFSSPNYDYMRVGEETYLPLDNEENSAFLIPVSGFDYKMAVTADTVAMSTPHEIDYTLTFDSATLKKTGALTE